MDASHEEEPDRKIAGFGGRLGAFVIDPILLGIAGMIRGVPFSIRAHARPLMGGCSALR